MRLAKPPLALALSLLLLATTGCERMQNEMYKSAIQKALHESSLTGSAPTDEHVKALKSVDLSECPQDFREVYSTYIHAWEEEAAVNDARIKLDSQEGDAAAAGLLSTLFGSSETPWSDHLRAQQQLEEYKKRADADTSARASDVNDAARKYGLNITD